MLKWKVSESYSGLSLQVFIKKQLGEEISQKLIKRSIDAGRCMLNGRIERFGSSLVGLGDRIEFSSIPTNSKKIIIDELERILFVNEDFMAYNKPSGITSDDVSISNFLNSIYGQSILLHRLDKDTSGVLLFAKTLSSAKEIEGLFKQRLIKKTYHALVEGNPKPSGKIENYLGKLKTYQGQTLFGEVSKDKGLLAITSWKVEKSYKGVSLLLCSPTTGRTHQIRVHLSEMGHPILGDHQYGRHFSCDYKAKRMMLHASRIEFKDFNINAPLPVEFKDWLDNGG